jgi:hypothetical protein
LNKVEITEADLKDIFKEEESIEAMSNLLEEVKQCIRAVHPAYSNEESSE